jgi:hypothetical protein
MTYAEVVRAAAEYERLNEDGDHTKADELRFDMYESVLNEIAGGFLSKTESRDMARAAMGRS